MTAILDDLNVKTALYHHERGRVYRPTKLELAADQFSCPKCGTMMAQVRIRMQENVLSCPECRWSIHRDDLWKPAQEQKPAIREPGEATEDNPQLDDISVADTYPELKPTSLVIL